MVFYPSFSFETVLFSVLLLQPTRDYRTYVYMRDIQTDVRQCDSYAYCESLCVSACDITRAPQTCTCTSLAIWTTLKLMKGFVHVHLIENNKEYNV